MVLFCFVYVCANDWMFDFGVLGHCLLSLLQHSCTDLCFEIVLHASVVVDVVPGDG